MAWDDYTGRHRVITRRTSNACAEVLLRKPGSQYPNPIGSVCKVDGGWNYSYVGTTARLGPVRSAREAVKKTVSGYRSWVGISTAMRGSRKAKRRRR